MKQNNETKLGILVTIVILAAISLFFVKNEAGAAVYKLEEVDLAINPVPHSALIFIAEEKGFFTEQGLKINYHGFPTGKLALDALIGGGADIATTADVPIALAGLANQKISVISTIEYSNDNIQVVARRDSGISTQKNLIGKKIATTKGGGPLFFTHKFLEKYKIGTEDVKLVHLAPSDMVTSLIKGDIDAFIVFEPFPYLAKKELGNQAIAFSEADLYGETWNIVVMEPFDRENSRTIRKFLNALAKAEVFLERRPKESLGIVSKYSKVNEGMLSQIMKKQNYGLVLNELIVKYPKEEAIWAINKGLSSSSRIPDYKSLINVDYLEELNKEVTI